MCNKMEIKIKEEDIKQIFDYMTTYFTTERCGFIDNEGNIRETTNYLASNFTQCIGINHQDINWHCHPPYGICPSFQDFLTALKVGTEVVFTAIGYWIIHFPITGYFLTTYDYNKLNLYFIQISNFNPTELQILNYIKKLKFLFKNFNLVFEFKRYDNLPYVVQPIQINYGIVTDDEIIPIPLINFVKTKFEINPPVSNSLADFDKKTELDFSELHNYSYISNIIYKNIKTQKALNNILSFVKYYSRNLHLLEEGFNLTEIFDNTFKKYAYQILEFGRIKKKETKNVDLRTFLNIHVPDKRNTLIKTGSFFPVFFYNIFYNKELYIPFFSEFEDLVKPIAFHHYIYYYVINTDTLINEREIDIAKRIRIFINIYRIQDDYPNASIEELYNISKNMIK